MPRSSTITCRPIPMSSESVEAILAGRKTQTRRVIVPQPFPWAARVFPGPYKTESGSYGGPGDWLQASADEQKMCGLGRRCPYGRPGDHLWVKEDFSIGNPEYIETYRHEPWRGLPDPTTAQVYYRNPIHERAGIRFRSARFMPRWASRLTLKLLSVRAERLQDITEEDARWEGIGLVLVDSYPEEERQKLSVAICRSRRAGFRLVWDRLNAPRAHEWAANRWVWRLEFRPVEAA